MCTFQGISDGGEYGQFSFDSFSPERQQPAV